MDPCRLAAENYPNALHRAPFPLFFTNSLIVSTVVMAGNVVFCTLAGYGLAKFRFPGDRFALLAILSTLMLPLEVTLVPTFLIVHSLAGSTPTRGSSPRSWSTPSASSSCASSSSACPPTIWKPPASTGPASCESSGRSCCLMQAGAGRAGPLRLPRQLDQFLWPLAVVSRDEYRTYPLGLVWFAEDYGNPQTEQMAVAVMATIPVFVLFLLLQRLLKKGFGLTGLKG